MEKHYNIAMLAVSALNIISNLISKHYQMTPFQMKYIQFETFTRVKEDLTEKSKMSLEKTGNIETEANELLRRNKIGVPT